MTTTETTLSPETFGLPKSLLPIENHFELSKTWDHRIFWDHPGPYFQLNLLLDHQRLLDLQIIWNHQWPYFHLKIDSSSGPPNQPELPHPPEYPKDIKRTFLERPDWFLDRLTVIKKESCTHLGKHWRCWSRCPAVAEASSSTTVRDHKLQWFHQVNAACKNCLK